MKNNCIFCEKFQTSEKCFSAKRIPLVDKQKLLLRKGACFSFLQKSGLLSKNCTVKLNLKFHCNESYY